MFILRSFLFTLFSPSFYREAVQRGTKQAFSVFFAFNLIVTAITSIYFLVSFGIGLSNVPEQLPDFPDIEISDGMLTTDPAEPYEFTDGGQYFGMDSTGTITEIPNGYHNGVLLTKSSVIFRSEDNYGDTTLSYDDILNDLSFDTISVDHSNVASIIQKFGIVIMICSPVFIFIGTYLSTLFTVFIISILGLIFLSAQHVPRAFEKSFIIAMYASIPVWYVSILFWFLGKITATLGIDISLRSLCCLIPLAFTLIKWGAFWGLGAWGLTKSTTAS